MPEQTNPLERGTVGTGGNTAVTNFAYINVTIGEVQLTNIPLGGGTWEMNGTTYYVNSDSAHHALHDSGFNSYIKSFTCKRQVPKKVTNNNGFWQKSGGATECNVVIFDPTFVQFENLIMASVRNQKVHCKITYGISRGGSGKQPPPFDMHCFINEATENISNAGVEWTLKMSPVPPEWFDEFKEAGEADVKETVYCLTDSDDGKTKFNRVSDLVKAILESEKWSGIVVDTQKFSKSKEQKFPTKDYSSRVDFINRKLAPLARCADDKYASSSYQLIYQLDGSVFFMPVPMTTKEAIHLLETGKATAFGNYQAKENVAEDMNQETIESLNMQEYMSEDNGALVLRYGFKNSIVQQMSINFDSRSFISQFYFKFEYRDDKTGKVENFDFPEMPKDKSKQDENTKVINKRVHLYATNKDDAMQEAQMIVRKLHITNYQGTATLINWPYVGLCQIVKFEYLIPGGSKQSKTETNINKAETDVYIIDEANPDDKSKIPLQSEAYNNYVRRYGDTPQSNRAGNEAKNKDQIRDAANMSEKEKWQAIVASEEYQEELRKVQAKYANINQLSGNWENNERAYAEKRSKTFVDDHFNSNIGIPATLSSWNDAHKSSVGYYVQSITDTIKGGILTSELELIGWIKYDNPQLEAALRN